MSVYHASESDGCWLCGDALPRGTVVVFWYAAGGEITLHPLCAQELGNTLIFEARRAGMVQRGQNPLAGVVARSPRNGDPKVIELRRDRDGPR
jgi:hypothetical protein